MTGPMNSISRWGWMLSEAKFVGVKNMMNFRIGYREVTKGFFMLDLPGPTPRT